MQVSGLRLCLRPLPVIVLPKWHFLRFLFAGRESLEKKKEIGGTFNRGQARDPTIGFRALFGARKTASVLVNSSIVNSFRRKKRECGKGGGLAKRHTFARLIPPPSPCKLFVSAFSTACAPIAHARKDSTRDSSVS